MRATRYERMLLVDELVKQKADLTVLFDGLQRASQAALIQALPNKSRVTAVKRWQHMLELTVAASKNRWRAMPNQSCF